MDQLATIVRGYERIAIQEISDARGRVPGMFLDHINGMAGPEYAMSVSPRTGVHPDDRSSAEQYAFYWNTERVELVGADTEAGGDVEANAEGSGEAPALFPDGDPENRFHREPWAARFRLRVEGGFSFVVATVHTAPHDALEEIDAFDDVVLWARDRWADEDDFILLGDFNAGCAYLNEDELAGRDIAGEQYRWIVPGSADTNFSSRTECAYDRIVVTDNTALEWTGAWGVDDGAYTDPGVSDHWPVWAEFGAGEAR